MAIRALVIGLGQRGRDWVREIRHTPGFELAGCVDSDPARLSDAARTLDLAPAQGFANVAAAVERQRVDAVVIATPPADHAATAKLALAAGCAVLVEKPFTLALADAVELVRLAEEQRQPLLVAQNYRYMRAFRTVRRVVAEGLLGRLGYVSCAYYRVPHDIPAWLRASQHSVLWGAGVHHLDALRYVTGERVTRVLADSFSGPWADLPTGGSLRALLVFESGLRATYSATYESRGHEYFERGQEFYIRILGERGTLHVIHRWLVWCERGKLPRLIARGPRKITEERVLLQQLAAAIETRAETDLSGRDNLQTMALLEGYVRSSAAGAWVDPQSLLREATHA